MFVGLLIPGLELNLLLAEAKRGNFLSFSEENICPMVC